MMKNKTVMRISESYKDKAILITGGAGYLAHNLAAALCSVRCEIIRLFKPGGDRPWKFLECEARFEDVTSDIAERHFWEEMLYRKIDFIFHLAAQTSVYAANEDPLADMRVNVIPMIALLEACRRHRKSPTVIFAGTSTEVGMPTSLPINESVQDNPITVYDIHKLTAEKYLLGYARNAIVSGTSLRLTNVYGPGPKAGSADRGVLNLMVSKAIRGEALTIYGNGEYLRDYIFIDDVIAAFLTAGQKINATNGNYYLIGSGIGHRIADAINLVAERVSLKTGEAPKIVHISPPSGMSPIEYRNFVACISRFKQKTGWSPNVSLSEGIDRTIEYYQNNNRGGI